MKFERSEEDILSLAPIKVKFGSTEYEVKPLTILKARKWRESLIQEVKSISDKMMVDSTTNTAFYSSLAFVFLQFPEKMADLFFSYATELDRSIIEEEATEEQLAHAFGQIVKVAFPFVTELKAVSETLGIAGTFPASVKSMRPQ